MVTSSSTTKDPCQWTLVEPKMPNEKARTTIRRVQVRMPRAKKRKEKEIRKEMKVIGRANGKV